MTGRDSERWPQAIGDFMDPDSIPEMRGYTTAAEAFDLWKEQRLREDPDEGHYE